MYVGLAKSWSRGDFVPFDPLWPPGYPAVLAFVHRLLPLNAIFGLQLIALGVAMASLARLALHAGIPARTAILAAVLFGCDPQVASFVQTFWPETLHLAAALLLFEFCLISPPTFARGALAGLVAASALLLKNLLTPILPVLFLAQAARARAGRRIAVFSMAALVAVAVLAPVAIHNMRTQGFLGVSDSVPFNLVLGLTDTERRGLVEATSAALYREYLDSGSTFAERRRLLFAKLARLAAPSEIPRLLARQLARQPFRLLDRESTFSALLPGGSLHARGRGFRDPPKWLAESLRTFGSLHYGAMLLLAPLGFAVIRVERPLAARWILAWAGFVALAALCLHTQARHRVVLIPILALCAAQGARWLLSGPRLSDLSRSSILASGLASLVLLGLAFGVP